MPPRRCEVPSPLQMAAMQTTCKPRSSAADETWSLFRRWSLSRPCNLLPDKGRRSIEELALLARDFNLAMQLPVGTAVKCLWHLCNVLFGPRPTSARRRKKSWIRRSAGCRRLANHPGRDRRRVLSGARGSGSDEACWQHEEATWHRCSALSDQGSACQLPQGKRGGDGVHDGKGSGLVTICAIHLSSA